MSNDDTTRIIRRRPSDADYQEQSQEIRRTSSDDPEATRIVERSGIQDDNTSVINQPASQGGPGSNSGADSDKTRLVRPVAAGGIEPAPGIAPAGGVAQGNPQAPGEIEDPVVGWVVIVAGPGRGSALTLGYGMNQIGRNPDNRVPLPFGDQEVSRSAHAIITYDPRSRKYFVQPNTQGSNLTYLGAEQSPVLTPVELAGGELIRIGGTTLKFVPLCGEQFDWSDNTLV
tara:strand:+ start:11821 stop:12507 length:687 start_codon:yes stop_codon:yes gene_type:complete